MGSRGRGRGGGLPSPSSPHVSRMGSTPGCDRRRTARHPLLASSVAVQPPSLQARGSAGAPPIPPSLPPPSCPMPDAARFTSSPRPAPSCLAPPHHTPVGPRTPAPMEHRPEPRSSNSDAPPVPRTSFEVAEPGCRARGEARRGETRHGEGFRLLPKSKLQPPNRDST